jgi:hypothetical protein
MALARRTQSILARRPLAPTALASGALFTLLGYLACGGRAENNPASVPPEADAATGGATADGGAPQADSGSTPTVVSEFPLGNYDCWATFDFASPIPSTGTGIAWGNGTLSLALSGSVLTATFAGVSSVDYPVASGALEFLLSTGTSASPVAADQTLEVQCVPDGQGSPPSDTVNVTSGSLTLDADTLVLGFAGAFVGEASTGGLCPGQPLTGSLVCTKP